MGFLDTLKDGAKKLADKVTGGYGKVDFTLGKNGVLSPGENLPYRIQIDATGELKAKRVMVRVRGTETVRVDMEIREPDGTTRHEQKIYTNTTAEHEFQVNGEFEMKEGECNVIENEIVIPTTCMPTYRGRLATHIWNVEADVDVPMGKDLKKSFEINIR